MAPTTLFLLAISLFGSVDNIKGELLNSTGATQSGTWNGFDAGLAVDGDTNPDVNATYCSITDDPMNGTCLKFGWWMVEFDGSEIYAVDAVTIYSRMIYSGLDDDDAATSQLGYISIRVSDSPDIRNHTIQDECASHHNDTFPEATSMTFNCHKVMYGRYLSIQRTRGSQYDRLALCEVEVNGRLIDKDCPNCLDIFCDNNPYQRCEECAAGWQAPECRLPCDRGYYGINCAESCGQGCSSTCDTDTGHCAVCLGDWLGDKCDIASCKAGLQPPACETICPNGQYGAGCTEPCSASCSGDCDPVDGHCINYNANLALGQPTEQSGLYWTLTSDLAVDGDPDPDLENRHCACTSWPRFDSSACDEVGWWMVDLGSAVTIDAVGLYGSDGFNGSLGFISVRVSNSSDIEVHIQEDECVLWNAVMFPSTISEILACRETMTGRYLSIQRTMGDIMYMLCMCEVVVSGWPSVPTITSIYPLYGPVSGGTLVTILGSNFGDETPVESVVKLDDFACDTLEWNDTRIVVSTPNVTAQELASYFMFIALSSVDRITTRHNELFVYKPDPEITDVEPLAALATGGIRLTVTGNRLNSVAQTIMTVTRRYTDGTGTTEMEFRSLCTEVESTTMICPTPEIDDVLLRKKRDLFTSLDDSENVYQDIVSKLVRPKRETPDEILEFYLGFIQDGFEGYRDLRDSPLREKAYLKVIENPPEIKEWNGVTKHKDGDSITIEGEGMNVGCGVDDYVVTIGTGECTDLDLTANAVLCLPPKKPSKVEAIADSDGHHVYVSIGYHQAFVGKLKYSGADKLLDDPLVLIGISAGAFVLVLILVVICCCCFIHRRRTPDAAQENSDGYLNTGAPQSQGHDMVPVVRRSPNKAAKGDNFPDGYLHTKPYGGGGYEQPVQRANPYGGYEQPVQQGGGYIEAGNYYHRNYRQ